MKKVKCVDSICPGRDTIVETDREDCLFCGKELVAANPLADLSRLFGGGL